MPKPDHVLVTSSETGATFLIDRRLADNPTLTPAGESPEVGYEQSTVPQLRDEIDRRNESRDDNKIPTAGTKADLIAALMADDDN